MNSSLRRPFGVLAIIVGFCIYAIIVVRLFDFLVGRPILLQLPVWAVLGVIWVWPLKPVIRWMETGRWKR